MSDLVYIWVALSIGLAWVGVAIGQWILTHTTMNVMGKNPSLTTFFLTVSILWVALIESSAIYGLVISFAILWKEAIAWVAALWAGITIGLTWCACWLSQGILAKSALEAINRNPENKAKVMAFMVLFMALIEVIAIYGLVIAFKIIG